MEAAAFSAAVFSADVFLVADFSAAAFSSGEQLANKRSFSSASACGARACALTRRPGYTKCTVTTSVPRTARADQASLQLYTVGVVLPNWRWHNPNYIRPAASAFAMWRGTRGVPRIVAKRSPAHSWQMLDNAVCQRCVCVVLCRCRGRPPATASARVLDIPSSQVGIPSLQVGVHPPSWTASALPLPRARAQA